MMRTALVVVVLFAPWLQAGEPAWPARRSVPGVRERLVAAADQHLAEARQLAIREERGGAHELARRAIAEYEEALRDGPSDPELHYRAYLAAELYPADSPGTDDFETIIRHVDGLRAAEPLDPRDVDVTGALCHALARLAGASQGPEADAFYARAINEYERMFRLIGSRSYEASGDLAVSYANVAELLMAVGRLDEAVDAYRLATTLPARDLPALRWYGLAVALDRLGQGERAREAMVRALELDPSLHELGDARVYFVPDGDVHYYEAFAYEVAGRIDEARSEYGEFLRVASAVRPAYRSRATARMGALEEHGKARHR